MTSRNFAGILLLGLVFLVTACGGGGGGGNNAPVVTAEIGPQGGTVTASDGTQVIIPAGAVESTTTISVKISSVGAPALPDGVVPGTIYEFTPHDVVFNQPVTIRIPVPEGATGDQVFFASPGGEWVNYAATASNGFAELQRSRFSWAIAAACGPNTNNDPYHCVYPKGNTEITATPSNVLSGNGAFNYINAEGTVHITMHYSAARDCQSPILKLSTTDNVEIFNQTVALTPVADDPQRSAGTTTVDIPYSYTQNNRSIWYQANFSCKRSIWRSSFGGSDYFLIRPSILPPGTYSVSVNATGVYDTGLVLQNNAGDNLSIPYNGTFNFSTPLAVGASYSVSILSQPLGYTCTLQNASGTSQVNITNVAVNCVINNHTISGNVSGLNGTGLVLQNNGGNNLAISANGAFTFVNTVAGNTNYSVSILSQPSGQTCTLQNASGTALANVINVAVNCVTNNYTIGGNVSGLSGSGLVLQNNGGNNLSVTSNGVFAFVNTVSGNATYSVSILSQPSGQTCALQNASGTALANVTNVIVSCVTNNYIIGGNVSGLSGSGLVLQNNGGNNLSVTSNGVFAFVNTVAGNATYSVSILSQPSGQTCTLQNASGTALANVTNVTVNCVTNNYTIGGTVSGLTGTGLVLQNNNGNNLSVTADGAFTFSNTVAGNATYSVSILSQPSGQTCTLQNASGTALANVTNVAVNCVTNNYTIGGTVSGLTGTGLVLQNNNGNNLSVTADGAFTFSNTVAGNATYSVSVFSQPTGQICSVQNASGTVQTDVTNVNVNCLNATAGSFGGVEAVTSSNAVQMPSVAMDASGNAFAVWYQYGSGAWNVWANRYVAGTGWGTPVAIETETGVVDTSTAPGIAVDANGNAMAVWAQQDSTYTTSVWANRYVTGSGWGTATLVENNNNGLALHPHVAMDASGNAIAVWMQWDGVSTLPSVYGIWASRYTSGAWGTPELIDNQLNTASGHAYDPRVAMDDAGNAVAIWRENDGNYWIILANRFVAGSGWGTAETIEDNASNAYEFDIAMSHSDGSARAVWRQDYTPTEIWTNAMSSTGVWGGSAVRVDTGSTSNAVAPRVAMNALGDAVIVWTGAGANHADIFAKRYDNGVAGTAVVISSTANMGDANNARIVLADNGNAVAVWQQFDNAYTSIFASQYSVAGNTWNTPVLVENSNTLDAPYPPVMCGNTSGQAMAAWVFNDSTFWSNYFSP